MSNEIKETKVTYKKDRVILNMSREHYCDLLKGFNHLKDANNHIMECQDLYMSEISNLNLLEGRMFRILGFVKKHEGYWSDAITTEEQKIIEAA